MARQSFDDLRNYHQIRTVDIVESFRRRRDGWAVFPGIDERGYPVIVQQAYDDKEIMVRVGCRFFTLKEARKHWVSARRNETDCERRTAAQILMLIKLGLDRAAYKNFILERTAKFNTTPRKKL